MQTPVPEFGEAPQGTQLNARHAAYVVIEDDRGRIAVVRGLGDRRDFYWLPGGGRDTGESPKETIIREVKEELGRQVKVGRRIGAAIQVFFARDEDRWFRMNATFFRGHLMGPQSRAPEHEMEWVEPDVACRGFFHHCHTWAVRNADTAGRPQKGPARS